MLKDIWSERHIYGVVILYRKDTDYALIMGRINGVLLAFVNFILVVLWLPEVLSAHGTVCFSHKLHSSASIAHFRFLISAELKIVWLKEIFRLAQGGGELSIFWVGNARPAVDGKALSTL